MIFCGYLEPTVTAGGEQMLHNEVKALFRRIHPDYTH